MRMALAKWEKMLQTGDIRTFYGPKTGNLSSFVVNG